MVEFGKLVSEKSPDTLGPARMSANEIFWDDAKGGQVSVKFSVHGGMGLADLSAFDHFADAAVDAAIEIQEARRKPRT